MDFIRCSFPLIRLLTLLYMFTILHSFRSIVSVDLDFHFNLNSNAKDRVNKIMHREINTASIPFENELYFIILQYLEPLYLSSG